MRFNVIASVLALLAAAFLLWYCVSHPRPQAAVETFAGETVLPAPQSLYEQFVRGR